MELKELFIERLKIARQKKGITQEKLSELTGINQTLISKYEQGIALPGLDNLQKLIIALEVTADFFLLPQAKLTEVPKIKDPILFEKYFILESLDDKEKECVIYLLNSVIAQHKLKEITCS
jgi:transcriptional regulator with XRE-family HTH domain